MTTHKTLLLGPLPGPLLTALAARLTPDMTLIVPNVQAGTSVARYLALRPRILTLTQLARSALRRDGWSLLRPGERDRMMQALLDELQLEYLDGLRRRPGTLSVVAGLIGEFQRANVTPAALQAVAGSPRERDVARLYGAYHSKCQADRRYDAAGAEHLAASLSDLPGVHAVAHGFAYLDAAQQALISRVLLPGSAMTLPAGPGAASRTLDTAAALVSAGWAPVQVNGAPSTVGDRVMAAGQGEVAVVGLRRAEYADLTAEVRGVLQVVRDRLEEGVPPEEIAVIVRTEARYVETLADVAAEYRIPLLSGLQRSLLDTGLGRLVQAWLTAHTSGWSYAAVRALLTDPLLEWPPGLERARQLRTRRPAGLSAWDDDLLWLAVPDPTTRAQAAGVVRRLLTWGGVPIRCRVDPELNRLVATLLRHLPQGAAPCEQGAALGSVAAALRAVTLPALLTPSGVRVLNPLGALGRQFRVVAVLGLSSGIFPARRSDHPLVDATTRARWAAQEVIVPDVTALAGVEHALFRGCVAAARDELIVTRPRRDVAGAPLLPSPFWEQLARGTPLDRCRLGSALEREVECPGLRGQVGAALDAARSRRVLTLHSGMLPGGFDVATRTWTLQELQLASICRYRWYAESLLGLTDPERVWADLQRTAVGAALCTGDGQAQAMGAADSALERRAHTLARTRHWRPGRLWAARRLELLGGVRMVYERLSAQGRQFGNARSLPARWAVGGRMLTVRARVDLVELHGRRQVPTVLLRGETVPGARLTPGHVLALSVQAARASAGQSVSVVNGDTLHTLNIVGPQKKVLAEAQEQLAAVVEAIASGDVRPSPVQPRVCGSCPVRAVCRVGQLAVSA
ncbi:hypothetical protein GCM10010840_29980 [Deinococcus aerolatus]|uniref:PD-(D/E)XK endonuclease-like domain-containing protein n=1 Tax=Deinococcus aerolatus TaxID=522487 RepID=A0ABQ2GDS6_9DEIO|nr:hypothetical protein [Deinococcus aerolatus]GGL89953.1 hypothetical protein GCM10010840_29980 [Deinococcus aerolatus]